MDPFAPTDAEPPRRIGEIDVGRAVSDGLAGVFRNVVPLIGAYVVGGVAYVLSLCTCIGWIVVLPVLLRGTIRFLLQVVDGKAEVSTLWNTGEEYGRTFARMWSVMLLFVLLLLPTILIGAGIGAAAAVDRKGLGLDPVTMSVVGLVPGTLYSFFLVRFVFAPFLAVDRNMRPFEAFGESWRLSAGVWGRLAVLQLLTVVLNLPGQALNIGLQVIMTRVQEAPELMAENFGVLAGLTLGMYVFLALSGTIGYAVFAAAYRQRVGPPVETR